MSGVINQDYQLCETLVIRVDAINLSQNRGVTYSVLFDFEANMDTSYMIKAGENTYTLGNGITLDTENLNMTWVFNTADFESGINKGYILSDSDVSGIFLHINLEIIVNDKNIS